MFKGYTIKSNYEKDIPFIKKGKKSYLEQYICLDTETSHNHQDEKEKQECWIYQWAFTFNKSIYYGRTPIELCEKLCEISSFYNLNTSNRIKIFIHNLPYDFSYLVMFFDKYFGGVEHILAYANHKVFNIAYNNGLEFFCSYKLSNDSLDRWSKKLNTKHKKLVGAIDYGKINTQFSQLNYKDWKYMFYDVIVLDECIYKQMELYNDNIATLPLTSTGYTRREILQAYKGKGKHKKMSKDMKSFKDTALNYDTYNMCRLEFSGGITHGNRLFKSETINGTIRHRDFVSHYPSQQRTKKFPMGRFNLFSNEITIDKLVKYKNDYAILCDIYISNCHLRDKKITLPYLQLSHCLKEHTHNFKYLDDNGRVIYFEGTCHMVVDLNELLLIKEQYTFTYVIKQTYASMLDYLPPFMTETIDKHFKGKSDLKNLVKQLEKQGATLEEINKAELDLLKSKNVINGIYGVSATDIVRQDITLNGNEWNTNKLTEEEVKKKISDYYKSYNNCMRYQWGCYTTIYARLELMHFIKDIIGYENFLYADTDSCFYLSNDDIEKRIEEENKRLYQDSIDKKAYIITDKNETIVYNQFTDENEDIISFRFLHSKCYAYITNDGVLHSTIAGVQKKCGKFYQTQELQTIDNLKDGFTFYKCGGTKASYVEKDIHIYKNNITCGGCIITRTTKTLNDKEFIDREEIYINDRY